jgi:hypothetical protein
MKKIYPLLIFVCFVTCIGKQIHESSTVTKIATVIPSPNLLYAKHDTLQKVDFAKVALPKTEAEKIALLRKIRKSKKDEPTVFFKKNTPHISQIDGLEGLHSTSIALQDELFITDLNQDGGTEIVYWNKSFDWHRSLIIWGQQSDQSYRLLCYQTGQDVEELHRDSLSQEATFQVRTLGCCGDEHHALDRFYLRKQGQTICTKTDSVLYAPFIYAFPNTQSLQKRASLNSQTFVYAQPNDSIGINVPQAEYVHSKDKLMKNSYRCGIFDTGTRCTVLEKYKDKTQKEWYFVLIDAQQKPKHFAMTNFDGVEGYFTYRLYVWVKAEDISML